MRTAAEGCTCRDQHPKVSQFYLFILFTNRRNKTGIVPNINDRYHTDRGFPMLDSFPNIYLEGSGKPSTDSFGIKTSLSTDTSVSAAITMLRSTVATSIGMEDREDIGNELADLADAYREGWSSGSDEDDD